MSADDRKRHERAVEQGRQAFRAGRKVDACPYRQGTSTKERNAWLQGYDEARAERGRGR